MKFVVPSAAMQLEQKIAKASEPKRPRIWAFLAEGF
jgi:hypothetical protein